MVKMCLVLYVVDIVFYLLHFLKVEARSLNILGFRRGAVSLVGRPVAGLQVKLQLGARVAPVPVLRPRPAPQLALPRPRPQVLGRAQQPRPGAGQEGARGSARARGAAAVQGVLPGHGGARAAAGGHVEQLGGRGLGLARLVHVQRRRGAELDGRVAAAAPIHQPADLLVARAAAARAEHGGHGGLVAGDRLGLLAAAAGHLAPLPLLRVGAGRAPARLNTDSALLQLLAAGGAAVHLLADPDDVLELLLAAVIVRVRVEHHGAAQPRLGGRRPPAEARQLLGAPAPPGPLPRGPQVQRHAAVQVCKVKKYLIA